ncbi:MAG: hypothetical protein ACOX59_06640 [Bacteroidales bacterium]|jgi:hypothetical protein|nr:hypothetical protein [Bacteroidota bacterium]HOD26167.1 hypothetical protein [Bacteroidales bacterium]HQM93592.1 hypothetical protein [Bacteroidales bacterium]
MKTTIYLTILFSLIFLTSCEKENDKTDSPTVKKTIHFDGKTDSLKVKKIIYSDCLDDSKNSVSTLSCVTLQAIAGNHLQIQRQTMFCCGTEKVDISVEIRHDTIHVQEIDLGPFSYCYCWHNLEYQIGPLNTQNYTLQLIGCETSYDRDSILVNFEYAEDLYFTNCY